MIDAGVDAGPPPPNDFCAGAIALTFIDGGATVFGDLTTAKSDSAQCSSLGPDVYYSFYGRSPMSAQLIRLDGGAWTPHVMIETNCGTSYLACDKTQPSPTATYASGGSGLYFVQVDAAAAGAGAFQLNVIAAPITPGDLCANIVTASLGANPGTTTNTEQNNAFGCGPYINDQDVFFSFQAPDAGAGVDAGILTATVLRDAGTAGMMVQIRRGSACPGTVGGATCDYGTSPVSISIPAVSGPYVIVVGGYDSQTGPFTLQLSIQ